MRRARPTRSEPDPTTVKAEVRRMIEQRRRTLEGVQVERSGVTEGQGGRRFRRGSAVAVRPDGLDGGVAL